MSSSSSAQTFQLYLASFTWHMAADFVYHCFLSKAHTLPFSPGLNVSPGLTFTGCPLALQTDLTKSEFVTFHIFSYMMSLCILTLQGVFPYAPYVRHPGQKPKIPNLLLPTQPYAKYVSSICNSISQPTGSWPRLVLGATVHTSLLTSPHHLHGNCRCFIELVIVTGHSKRPSSNSSSTSPLTKFRRQIPILPSNWGQDPRVSKFGSTKFFQMFYTFVIDSVGKLLVVPKTSWAFLTLCFFSASHILLPSFSLLLLLLLSLNF